MNAMYAEFLAGKRFRAPLSNLGVNPDALHPSLFGFQSQIVRWAVERGRCAVFADTGLGKTRMQVEWARVVHEATGGSVLILAPLAVTAQTVAEARQLGVDVRYVRERSEVTGPGLWITNYERLDRFDPARFVGVVLDESSILKAFSGVRKRALVTAFRATPYRLCCTATPAPNDLEELCNHADFLGVMTAQEMRSTFFIADNRGQFMKYRIKGHAREAFIRWMTTWSIFLRMPSDLGWPDDDYLLPPLNIEARYFGSDWAPEGQLFATDDLGGVQGRAELRRNELGPRCRTALELFDAEPDESWLIWCGTNAESALLATGLRTRIGAAIVAEVRGSDDPDCKASALLAFADGGVRCLVTKPSLAGFGMNFQRCARMAFVGLSDSYEQYYQAIRRCWRYGQKRPVDVYVVLAEPERAILANVRRKEAQARTLADGVMAGALEAQRQALRGTTKGDSYEPRLPLTLPDWLTEEVPWIPSPR
jgi:helicase-like protein